MNRNEMKKRRRMDEKRKRNQCNTKPKNQPRKISLSRDSMTECSRNTPHMGEGEVTLKSLNLCAAYAALENPAILDGGLGVFPLDESIFSLSSHKSGGNHLSCASAFSSLMLRTPIFGGGELCESLRGLGGMIGAGV